MLMYGFDEEKKGFILTFTLKRCFKMLGIDRKKFFFQSCSLISSNNIGHTQAISYILSSSKHILREDIVLIYTPIMILVKHNMNGLVSDMNVNVW